MNLDHTKVTISKGRLITYGRVPGISAIVTNKLDEKIDLIWVSVELYDSKGLFGACKNDTEPFAAKETREILIECHRYESEKIPEETTFKTRIDSALKYKYKH